MKHALTSSLALLMMQAAAQNLPPPSRTVYRCEVDGKVQYSDAPCVGARKVDVEPTRGMDRATGQQRRGADVTREIHREQIAEALKPVTGLDARQLDQAGRRYRLDAETQQQCRLLDRQLPIAESAERQARTAAELKAAQQQLYEVRQRFHKARCD